MRLPYSLDMFESYRVEYRVIDVYNNAIQNQVGPNIIVFYCYLSKKTHCLGSKLWRRNDH